MKRFLRYLLLFTTIVLQWHRLCFAETGTVKISIDNPNFRQLVVAIPDLYLESDSPEAKNLALSLNQEFARLLEFSGLFRVMKKEAFQDILTLMNTGKVEGKNGKWIETSAGLQPDEWSQWTTVGTETVLVGIIRKSSNDGFDIVLKAFDINSRKEIVARKFLSATSAIPIARSFADLILEAYTGKPGIFNTKIALVGKKNKGDSKQIFIADFDGSNLKQISSGDMPHVSPAWSPDGRYIAYTSWVGGSPEIYLYDVKTDRTRRLTNYQGLDSGANWAPNGRVIAFSGSRGGNTDLFLIEPSGAKRRLFIQGSGLDVDPKFSPDGNSIAFVSGRYGNPHIFVAQLHWKTDTHPVAISDKRLTYAGWYNSTPDWSPDSDKLVFAGYDKDIDRYDIFMMNPDGTKLERLTLKTGDNESPVWSPNGQLIMFQSNRIGLENRKGLSGLYIMQRDGSHQTRLNVDLYEAYTPTWARAVLK